MNLGALIEEGNQASLQDRTKTLIFLHHHLHEGLKKKKMFLMTNHQSRPTRFESFPEVNAILSQTRR